MVGTGIMDIDGPTHDAIDRTMMSVVLCCIFEQFIRMVFNLMSLACDFFHFMFLAAGYIGINTGPGVYLNSTLTLTQSSFVTN